MSEWRFYHTLKDRAWNRERHVGLTAAGSEVQLRSWDAGVEIHCFPDLEDPAINRFVVYATNGSPQSEKKQEKTHLLSVIEAEGGVEIHYPDGREEKVIW